MSQCPINIMAVLMLVVLLLISVDGFHRNISHSGLVIVAENEGRRYYPSKYPSDLSNNFQADQNLCPGRTFCTTLSQCPLLLELMQRSCLIPSKLKELTCGYQRSENMVCCPLSGAANPWGNNPSHQGDESGEHETQTENPDQGAALNRKCGVPQLNGWKNGYTGVGSHPWVARIGFKNSETGGTDYPCCGSVITSRVVLTAAHCALAKSEGHSLSSVRVGEYDMKTDPDCTNSFCAHSMQNIEVSHVIVHPGFERSIFRHDVALLVLKKTMNFTLAVQPICLLQNEKIELEGRRGKLIGWGKLPGQDVVPSTEQQVELPIVSLSVCSKVYSKVIPITSNQLCVGGELKKDACSGFGGAPLVLLDHITKDRYYQVGMVSFGSDRCGAAGIPSVHTNIQHYYDWIKTNIPS